MTSPGYRDFAYPLNVFMHILTREEGGVEHLHYGLFDRAEEPIARAQERSTELLWSRLPPPPVRVLDVGSGLGTTLARLIREGYDATGLTPDATQVAAIRARHGPDIPVFAARFEDFAPDRPFDLILFQESSQYVDSGALFSRARGLAPRIVVLDEFTVGPPTDELSGGPPDTLHGLEPFLAAAAANGFALREDVDVSRRAAPTIDYFMDRLERHRPALVGELGLDDRQVDELIASGERYRDRYARGRYVYRLLRFTRRGGPDRVP